MECDGTAAAMVSSTVTATMTTTECHRPDHSASTVPAAAPTTKRAMSAAAIAARPPSPEPIATPNEVVLPLMNETNRSRSFDKP